MHVIARPAILKAQQRFPSAASWLDAWWETAGKAEWRSLKEVRSIYRDADEVGQCLVFNACGNNYRLICRITYANSWTRGTLLVKYFLTHSEYDKNKWCKDCMPAERP